MTSESLASSMVVLERGWVSSNNILLFDDENTATLIDSGYVDHQQQTLQLVQHALAGRALTRVFNTHLHSDHCGGNAMLKREFGAVITIPPGHADAVQRWDEAALGYSACGQACERFMFDALIKPGDRLTMGSSEWHALASPGHDPDSIVLWNLHERTLISADALWEHGFGAIFVEVEGESGFVEQRAILQLIQQLQPLRVIPGHGRPFSDVDQALQRAFARLDALEADPERNARNVVKTLIKFYLLIVGRIRTEDLIAHFDGRHYFDIVNQRFFQMPFEAFMRRMLDELVAGGALFVREGIVVNQN